MQISKLLKELNITFGQLQNYQEYLDVLINDANQEIDEDTYLKVIALYNSQEIQNEIATKEQNKQILAYDGYVAADGNKFLAKIKWYYNKAKDGEYGFAEHKKLKSIFFRGQDVKGVNPHHLREGETVIVNIGKNSLNNLRKINATSVNRLEHETDIVYLLNIGVYKNRSEFLNQALSIALSPNYIPTKSEKSGVQKLLNTYLFEIRETSNKLIDVLKIVLNCGINLSSSQKGKINSLINSFQKFNLFSVTNFDVNFKDIEDQLVNYIFENPSQNSKLIAKITREEKQIVLLKVFNTFLIKNNNEYLSEIINLLRENDITIDYNLFSISQLTTLWLNNDIDFFPLDAIYENLLANKILKDKEYEKDYNSDIDSSFQNKINKIFNKINKEENTNLFYKSHFEIDEIKDKKDLENVLFFIDNTKDDELKEVFLKTTLAKSSDFIKLKLFLKNYTNELAYHNAVIYTGVLSSTDQKLFFKKVLMLIETKALDLTLNDLNKITSYTYTENEWSKEIDGTGLDFTLSVILKLVTDLSNNVITQRGTIFEIIANQIKTPKDLLVIDGFFDRCTGRVIEKSSTIKIKDDEGKEKVKIIYSLDYTNFKPRFSEFCDGRKAINKNTGEPVLSNDSSSEFWWCENRPCFQACRSVTSSGNWQYYNLQDVLRILNISYKEQQYEILLNVINRVNRYLEHLTCKCCNSILRPNGKSNYAFYGVSMFSCTNMECEKPDVDVYLTHCLNGKCESIIDSRESVKCKPSSLENPDNCGWYICNECYSCCSNEKLTARKNNLERYGQEYTCHTKGHKDLGIICCNDCGTEMKTEIANTEMYKKQLEWFIKEKDNGALVASGQRTDGKWWFKWHKGNLSEENFRKALSSLRTNGFQIPDYYANKDIQFISEPYDNTNEGNKLECPNCDNVINFNDRKVFPFSRLNSIKSFHKIIFPLFMQK